MARIAAASSGLTTAEASGVYEDMIFYDKVFTTVLVLLLSAMGVLIMVLARRPEREMPREAEGRTANTQTHQPETRTIQTQSMVTYRRELSTPRFAVLAEREQGAWEHD